MRIRPDTLIVVATVALVSATLGSVRPATAASDGAFPLVVSPERAAERIEAGEVDVLDSRSESAWSAGHIPKAVRVDWEEFTPGETSDRGELFEDLSLLQEKLRALGVDEDRPVFVVGDPPDHWGEDGRIVWMLRRLGHERTALVDGGHDAVVEAGIEQTDETHTPETGDLEVAPDDAWHIDREGVRALLQEEPEDVVLVDTRSAREFAGATPYGEARGGHIPGAKHLHYRSLLDDRGRLLDEVTLRERLQSAGIDASDRVVAYCTGGVRSAWLTVVLESLGYEAANYAGSAWDWAAASDEDHPLVER